MINFSGRELEIIKFIIKGYSKKNIADELNISFHTVKAIIEKIYLKTDTHNKVQLIIFLLKNNFVFND